MTIERGYSVHANGNGYFWVTYYCYDDKCPVRTKEQPWPRSDGEKKLVELISKKGNKYKRRRWFCVHCGKEMTGTVSLNDFG